MCRKVRFFAKRCLKSAFFCAFLRVINAKGQRCKGTEAQRPGYAEATPRQERISHRVRRGLRERKIFKRLNHEENRGHEGEKGKNLTGLQDGWGLWAGGEREKKLATNIHEFTRRNDLQS